MQTRLGSFDSFPDVIVLQRKALMICGSSTPTPHRLAAVVGTACVVNECGGVRRGHNCGRTIIGLSDPTPNEQKYIVNSKTQIEGKFILPLIEFSFYEN